MLKISGKLSEDWQGQDIFEKVFSLNGQIFREKDGRKTICFKTGASIYFAKLHKGVGWKKIIRYLFQFRLPVLSAQNEWQAIKRFDELSIHTTPLVGYGKKGINPAQLKSFVITKALTGVESLEDFCRDWTLNPPGYALKRALIIKVAKIARTLHEHNIYHRDFYICHFLIDLNPGNQRFDPGKPKLHVIDLHRVLIRNRQSNHLRIKDIAGLYFSSMDIGLNKRDIMRFIRIYKNKPLKNALDDNIFWRKVRHRSIALYQKIHKKAPILPD